MFYIHGGAVFYLDEEGIHATRLEGTKLVIETATTSEEVPLTRVATYDMVVKMFGAEQVSFAESLEEEKPKKATKKKKED